MVKNIYIHIGPHKTGTTTVQKGLWINRERLKENDYLCPKSGQPYPQSAGTHNLAWQLGSNKKFSAESGTWDDLVKEIGKSGQPDNVILSSEAFSNLSLKEIKIIKKEVDSLKDLLSFSFEWSERDRQEGIDKKIRV